MAQTKVPVLLIVFNRPELTLKLIEQLRSIKPSQLFVAADGARVGKNEEDKVQQVRSLIDKEVDWNCEVKKRFLDENIGCGLGVSSAISWFFEYVNHGIILEDDCIPDASFFPFCEELLEKYKNDTKVMEIRSSFHLGLQPDDSLSYSFSRISGTWGWATWKRAWDHFDYDIKEFPKFKEEKLLKVFKHSFISNEIMQKYQSVYLKEVDTWDFQWQFTIFNNEGVSIIPHKILVRNIGFGEDATHCFVEHEAYKPVKLEKINFPLIHPSKIEADIETDISFYKFWKNANKESFINKVRKYTPNSLRVFYRKMKNAIQNNKLN